MITTKPEIEQSIKLDKLLAKPSKFKDREIIHLKNVKFINRSDNNLFTFNVKGGSGNTYQCEIQIDQERRCKFHCNCDSFKYQFAYLLNQKKSLLYPNSFNLLNKHSKTNSITYVCKHLESCINFLKGVKI